MQQMLFITAFLRFIDRKKILVVIFLLPMNILISFGLCYVRLCKDKMALKIIIALFVPSPALIVPRA